MKTAVSLLTILLAQFSADALSAVTRVETSSMSAYGTFKAGEYNRWELRVFGELSPQAEAIPDLEKAPRNANGMVDYSTRVTLLAPSIAARGNGALLIDIPNRGRAIASSLYNSPRNVSVPLGSFDPGTGFLQDYGFMVAAVSWELGYGVDLPSFIGPDGKPRFVEGAALPIVRDVAHFLASAGTDTAGQRNPIAGATSRTIGLGYSQTGRFLKSFLLRGFNTVEGRRLFAGMHILGAASGHIVLNSVPGPNSGAGLIPTFSDPEVRGVNEEPLALAYVAEGSDLSKEAMPRMVFVNTTTDYFSLRASLGRTGAQGALDRPLPQNIRVYDIAGASHALIAGKGDCKYPYAVLDWHPLMRSTLLALDRWVLAGTNPPPSSLMPLRDSTGDSMALKAPAHLSQAIIQTPVLDQDGNATGGVRLPDMAAPIGTHAIQNPPLSFLCALGAGYVAFAKTRAEREASNDSRLSLMERYNDKRDYLDRIRASTRNLMRIGFLTSDDAAVIVHAAAEATELK